MVSAAWVTKTSLPLWAALVLQGLVHATLPAPVAQVEPLPPPAPLTVAKLTTLGDPLAGAYLAGLRLQAWDVQPGASLSWRSLDYPRLIGWLQLDLNLAPASQYPLLCASRLYAEVADAGRSRQMLAFIEQAFLQDPDRRWPWLAHGVILARHRLHDLPLALRYAHLLRTQIHDPAVPHWVTQLEPLALADLGEAGAARVLLGGMLASGTVTDPAERHFLLERLATLPQD